MITVVNGNDYYV